VPTVSLMWLVRLLSRLPLSLLYGVAWVMYPLTFYLLRYRRSDVRQNLRFAFPDKNEQERNTITRQFYRHFCRLAVEILKARTLPAEEFARRVSIVNEDLLHQHSEGGQKSLILLTLHQGNWEWALHAITQRTGLHLDAVYKPLHQQGWDRFIFEVRSRFGSRPVAMTDVTRDVLRRRRESRIFVMIADQSAPRYKGLWFEYLNREAVFFDGAEKIAELTGFPVLFGQVQCVKPGYYQIEFSELADPPYAKGASDITARYVAMAEDAIRCQPESFLWTNRRWKKQRPAECELLVKASLD